MLYPKDRNIYHAKNEKKKKSDMLDQEGKKMQEELNIFMSLWPFNVSTELKKTLCDEEIKALPRISSDEAGPAGQHHTSLSTQTAILLALYPQYIL